MQKFRLKTAQWIWLRQEWTGKMRQVRGISSRTIFLAVIQKRTVWTYFITDHFLGKLFLHKLAQDGSKHLQNFCILWIIVQKDHTSGDQYCFQSARQMVVLLGHFQSSACLNKMQIIIKHSVPRQAGVHKIQPPESLFKFSLKTSVMLSA
jgi:hypothetical protein